MTDFGAQLHATGMSAEEAAPKAALLEKICQELGKLKKYDARCVQPDFTYFVPGRLELFGKHTDYAGGRSIVGAIERGICLAAAHRSDDRIRIADVGRNSLLEFRISDANEPTCGHWSNFPLTVARRLARDFPELQNGVDIVFASDLPRASGMSSSSALVIAIFLALSSVNSLGNTERYRQTLRTPQDVAAYASAIESGGSFGPFSGDAGVGTHGGSEDHVAILCSRAGFLQQYSFCPIRVEREIHWPEGYCLIIAVSGVKADKTGDAREMYNCASGAVKKILQLWNAATRSEAADNSVPLASLLANPDTREGLHRLIKRSNDLRSSNEFLQDRLQQLQEESNEIVPAAANALASGDFERLGALADRSQFLAETCLGNQVPETIALAKLARQLGAVAASAFGAGFGGSVWAMVETPRAEEFCQNWAAQYHRRFPEWEEASRFFLARPGPGMIQLREN